MATLTKTDLVAKLAEVSELSKTDVAKVVAALEETLVATVAAGDELNWTGFLKVSTAERAARTGRNPVTGEAIEIAAKNVVKLTAGSKLKNAAAK